MVSSVDGAGGGDEATKVLNKKMTREEQTLKGQIASMNPSVTMDDQLEMTHEIQNLSLLYTMRINLMNTFSGLLMKAINAIRIPQA